MLEGPPERPEDFNNPEELRVYLKALNDYFSLVGRPRSLSMLHQLMGSSAGGTVAAPDHKIGQCIQMSALFPGRAAGETGGPERGAREERTTGAPKGMGFAEVRHSALPH